jgi:multidrug efflux pump
MMTKQELAPPEDRGFVLGIINGAPNATIDQTRRYTSQIQPMVKEQFPETDVAFMILGFDPSAGLPSPSGGMAGLVLKPWSERARSAGTLATQFTAAAGSISGLKVAAVLPAALPGAGSGLPVQYVVSSTQDHARVVEVADELLRRALASGKFVYADNGLKFDQPQVDLIIDKDKAALLGIDMSQLGADLGSMLGGGYVNRFSIEGRAYKVTPQVTRTSRLTAEQLGNYYISTGTGALVPLSSIATLSPTTQPRNLTRFQQLNSATLGFVPAPGVSLGDALTWLNTEAKQVFPEGFTADYKGELRQYVQEGSSLFVTFGLALLVIFLVLAAQYESWRDPIVIMLAVPLSLAGALLFLFLGFATLNIYTQVGLITLVGLITKHGILMVEFANQTREERGCSAREAIEHAAGVRLRPILMTTAAMVFGVLPLVFAKGAGAEARYSMGLVIATGMSIGTFFTLFVLPVFYTFIAKRHVARAGTAPATGAAAAHHA